ncbi:hypothetical protein [Streptomyces sp. NPDC057616]|uniref:hypothetical protein n=1 Tax=Streptomyces sp. NPDC057616 TaxID=3346183 RepID=UPI003696A206
MTSIAEGLGTVAPIARDPVDLDSVADELYGLRPEDFTSARDARAAEARRAGDRTLAGRIGKLRRPALAAWASNLLVRERPEEAESLLRLGEGLRQAHRDLDGAQLRELSRQQHVVIDAMSRQAQQLADRAGHPIGEDTRREVAAILHAVLADPGAAAEWATGRLVRAFDQVAGFPAAAEGARPRPARSARREQEARPARRGGRNDRADGRNEQRDKAGEERRRRLEQARRKAEDAERELEARRQEAAEADRDADTARERAESLGRRVRQLTEELGRVEEDRHRAEAAARTARERARDADRRVREARRRAGTAAGRVTRLRAQTPPRSVGHA